MLESTHLFCKKSGDEIVHPLFAFVTKGEEEVSMRPEVSLDAWQRQTCVIYIRR